MPINPFSKSDWLKWAVDQVHSQLQLERDLRLIRTSAQQFSLLLSRDHWLERMVRRVFTPKVWS
jgi:hypothetical protein